MSDQIKNRVVGTIVLFALAIIFLPKIFDGEKQTQRSEFVAIPKKPTHQSPDMSKVLMSDDKEQPLRDSAKKPRSKGTNSAGSVVNTTAVEKAIAIKEHTVKPVIPSKILPPKPLYKPIKAQAWVIRMGSFGNPDNVKALVAKLRKKGFTAFSIPSNPKVGTVNKVYVGPELNKKMLIKLQPQLKRSFKESGVIEKYEPLQ